MPAITGQMGDPARFKIEDAASYDQLAEEFDQFDEIRQPCLAALFRHAGLNGCRHVLDVGSGTGIAAFEAARRLGPGALAVGVDLSEGLLGRTRRKAQLGLGAGFVRADAETLPLRANSFDAAVSLFALLHFPDPQRAIEEMFRVLRPGGSAAIAVGSGPPWLSLAGLRHRLARSGDLLAMARGRLLLAPRFLDGLVARMVPSGGAEETELARHSSVRAVRVVALLRAAGFVGVAAHWDGFAHRFDDIERFWLVQRVYSSFARKRLNLLDEQGRATVKKVFVDRCRAVLGRGGSLVYPYAALTVTGRKPGPGPVARMGSERNGR